MKSTYSSRFIAILAAGLLVIAGCTDSDNDDEVAGPEATVTAGATATAVSPSITESPSPGVTPVIGSAEDPFNASDDVITIALKDPATLDPMLIGDPGSILVARQLYEGLVNWNPETRRLVPAAAESWTVRDGGATYVFKLRPGMTFHDGSPVASHDFKFAFERIARRSNASDLAYLLRRVKGFTQINALGGTKRLSGIKTPNDLTLVIELIGPDYDFPAVLTHPGLVPLAKERVADENEFLRNPVGNGSFRLARPWDAGDQIFLRAYEQAVKPPSFDGLRLMPYPEAAASWLDFFEGQVDVSQVPVGQIHDAATQFGRTGYKDLLNGYAYGFNLKLAALKSRKLRVAVNRAIDRQTIAKVTYKGILQPPRGIVPAGMPGFKEDVCNKLCEYSPPAARRLVGSLPQDARKLTLQFPEGDPHDQVAKLLKKDLKAVGFRVVLREMTFSEFFSLLQDERQSVYRLTWIAEYPSPDAYLGALFESNSPDNHSAFSSPKVDELLRKARAEPKRRERFDLYRRAERAILKQAPVVPLGYFRIHWAVRPEVSGLQFDAMGGFDAATATVEDGD